MTTPSLSSGDLTAADSGAGGENAPVCLLTVAPRLPDKLCLGGHVHQLLRGRAGAWRRQLD